MTPLVDDHGRPRPVTRATCVWWRGLDLQVRLAPEGLYLKGRGQRWTSAYLLPWAAAYDTAVKMRVAENRRLRLEKRKKK